MNIIFKNEDILVIEKSPGIVTIPDKKYQSSTLLDNLLKTFPELRKVNERGGILHRLDKDTSGLILIARNKKAFDFFSKSFEKKKIKKKYLALVSGKIKSKQGIIVTLISRDPKDRKKQKVFSVHDPQSKKKGLRKAITEYKALRYLSDREGFYTLVEVLPKTGRRHQIRVHFVHLGHPIVGDKVYGFKHQPIPPGLYRQFLHASYLKFEGPDGKTREFQSPLPKDLNGVLKTLKEIV